MYTLNQSLKYDQDFMLEFVPYYDGDMMLDPFHPHSTFTRVGLWLLNNHCHLKIEVSWRPHIVGFVIRIYNVLHHIDLCMSYVHTFFIPHVTS